MKKNVKSIFFVLTLVTLLCAVSNVSAVDDNSTDITVSDSSQLSSNDSVVTKEIATVTDNNMEHTKNIQKEKNIKTATKTVEVNDYAELTTAINNAVNDIDNDEYIINLNEGTYSLPERNTILKSGLKKPSIIINANNQTLTGENIFYSLYFNNNCNITINNAIINHKITNIQNNITFNNTLIRGYLNNQENTNITLINSTINSSITNNGLLIIDDNTVFTDSCTINGDGQIIINNITKVLPFMTTFNGNYTIENMTLTGARTNKGNLTIKNSNISILNNNGNLTMENSTCQSLQGNQYGNARVINCNITNQISLSGNITVSNSDINTFMGNSYSNITIINSTLKNSNTLFKGSNLNISDDCIFNDDFLVNVNNARIIYYDYAKIAPFLSAYYFDNYILENITISSSKTNMANLTIRNATLNTTITNNGNLTITDDVIFGENTLISGNGQIIINDTSKITPYLSIYNGTFTIKDTNITKTKTNNGNLTIQNSTITGSLTNNGNITIENSTLNTTITNNGNLTITDDVIFGENTLISGNGQIIINDTSKITPYLSIYNGTFTIKDTNITKTKTNNGNLTIENSTLNNILTNNGTLIISDDCILGDNFKIYARSNSIIISNLTNITSYITQYQGNNFTIENQILNKTIVNNYNTNITIINSTVNAQIKNMGIVIFENSIINANFMQQTFQATLILSDNTILGDNFSINSNGQFIANITNERVPYLTIFDNGTVSNQTLDKVIRGNNLTMINSSNSQFTTLTNSTIINSTFTGSLTLTNSTLNSSIMKKTELMPGWGIYNSIQTSGEVSIYSGEINTHLINNGILIIDDNTIIGENFTLENNGEIIINDSSKINPYISTYTGNITISDNILNGNKTNNNNLTLINTTVNNQLINNGNLTLNNSIINDNIINNGILIIDENTVFEENIQINGYGIIITDNIERLLPYISTINGNYTIKDTNINIVFQIFNFIYSYYFSYIKLII